MSHPEQEVVQRLGRDGLARVLDDLLDQRRLVRLANTCGLRYPGMRTQSQKRERILQDLVERAEGEDTTRRTIFRALKKETGAAARTWARLGEPEKLERVRAVAEAAEDGQLGLHLFLLAQDDGGGKLADGLTALLARPDLRPAPGNGAPADETVKLKRELARLKKRATEQQKKVAHLDGQLAKSRETARTTKRDLIQRKGELAESRLLVERLRKELRDARGAEEEAAAQAQRAPSDDALDKLARSVRRLSTEQRKLTHAVEALGPPRGKAAPVIDPQQLGSLAEGLQALQKEMAAFRRDRRKETKETTQQLDELRAEVRSYKTAVKKRVGGPLSRRRKGEPERVGVFVDVQNMYYGARRLKGKLDFDALLETAVRDRRRVQAKAYVVESKEIDQSGFISILEQRGIDVHRKTLRVRADGSMKGDWDMEMALDILDAAPRLDVLVLVSGDGDFTSLVQRVKLMGPRVEVIGWPRTTAKSLIESADAFQALDRNFMIRGERKRPKPAADQPDPAPQKSAG